MLIVANIATTRTRIILDSENPHTNVFMLLDDDVIAEQIARIKGWDSLEIIITTPKDERLPAKLAHLREELFREKRLLTVIEEGGLTQACYLIEPDSSDGYFKVTRPGIIRDLCRLADVEHAAYLNPKVTLVNIMRSDLEFEEHQLVGGALPNNRVIEIVLEGGDVIEITWNAQTGDLSASGLEGRSIEFMVEYGHTNEWLVEQLSSKSN